MERNRVAHSAENESTCASVTGALESITSFYFYWNDNLTATVNTKTTLSFQCDEACSSS